MQRASKKLHEEGIGGGDDRIASAQSASGAELPASKEPQPSPTEDCQRAGVHAGELSRAPSTRSGLSRSRAPAVSVNGSVKTAGVARSVD
jgi:hypothetical protein